MNSMRVKGRSQPGPSQSSQSQPSTSKGQPKTKRSAPTPKPRRAQSSSEESESENESQNSDSVAHNFDSTVSNGVVYFLVTSTKRQPVKRADFVKAVIGFGFDRNRVYISKVLQEVQHLLRTDIGLLLYGFNEQTSDYTNDMLLPGIVDFCVVSSLKTAGTKTFVPNLIQVDERSQSQGMKSILFIILLTIYMENVESGLTEASLWSTITTLKLNIPLSLIESNFAKFLKQEFVTSHYLELQTKKDDQAGETIGRYLWGPRAHLEFSKADMLIYVSKVMQLRPRDFGPQYKALLESDQKKYAESKFQEFELNRSGTGDRQSSEQDQTQLLEPNETTQNEISESEDTSSGTGEEDAAEIETSESEETEEEELGEALQNVTIEEVADGSDSEMEATHGVVESGSGSDVESENEGESESDRSTESDTE